MMAASNHEERSLADLLRSMTEELTALLRKEVELAKAEVQEQVSTAGKAAAMFAGTAVTGFVALVLLAMAAAWGLAEVVAPGVAFAIVGAVFAIVAAVLLSVARKRVAEVNPVPERTMANVREDIQTAKSSIARGAAGPSYG